jgi:hypothetical protein
MKDSQRLHGPIRDVSPCKDCTERFVACSDRCPKDERGEYGYKAWKTEYRRVKKEREQYLRRTIKHFIDYEGLEDSK